MIEEREIYYNPKVLSFLDFVGKVKVLMAGRGAGKTRGIGEDILDRASELPGAKIFMASTSFEAIDNNIMPDLREVFELHGLVEGQDFVIDKDPPAYFQRSKKRIEDPRNSVILFNGFAIQKVSFAKNVKRYRGRSFDGGIMDEALNLRGWDVDNVLLPTLRGYNHWDSDYWKMLSIYSSYPRTPEGSWFLRYQELAKKYPELYHWAEATAFDNLAVLGEDYIEDQRMSLGFVDFQIEIMNKGGVKDLPTLFYYQFRENKHTYRAEGMRDVEPGLPVSISFDFGGRYSCLTVTQQVGREERVVYEFDTNSTSDEQRQQGQVKKLPHIVRDFCRQFESHPVREVQIWGDRSGLNKQEMDDSNLYESIEHILKAHNWHPNTMVTSHNQLHKSRYLFMNSCLEEKIEDYPTLRVNAITCPNLIESLNRTKVTDEFKKDKREERNVHANQSHAPHLSDSLDYCIFAKYFYLLDDEFGAMPPGIEGGIDTL